MTLSSSYSFNPHAAYTHLNITNNENMEQPPIPAHFDLPTMKSISKHKHAPNQLTPGSTFQNSMPLQAQSTDESVCSQHVDYFHFVVSSPEEEEEETRTIFNAGVGRGR
jgi:hypothetical protein